MRSAKNPLCKFNVTASLRQARHPLNRPVSLSYARASGAWRYLPRYDAPEQFGCRSLAGLILNKGRRRACAWHCPSRRMRRQDLRSTRAVENVYFIAVGFLRGRAGFRAKFGWANSVLLTHSIQRIDSSKLQSIECKLFLLDRLTNRQSKKCLICLARPTGLEPVFPP
jgi:hypothetical protein